MSQKILGSELFKTRPIPMLLLEKHPQYAPLIQDMEFTRVPDSARDEVYSWVCGRVDVEVIYLEALKSLSVLVINHGMVQVLYTMTEKSETCTIFYVDADEFPNRTEDCVRQCDTRDL